MASWDPQNGAAGGTGLWSGYALPPSGPTGQASCHQPAKLIVAAQKRAEVVSRIEKKQRPPTLKLVIACFILFGAPAAELFPDISASIETDVMARVWEMYEKIQGDPSRKTKIKVELFEGAIARAEQRKHAPRS